MNKKVFRILFVISIIIMVITYWFFLPPLNIFSLKFWFFALEGLILLFICTLLSNSDDLANKVSGNSSKRKDVSNQSGLGITGKLLLCIVIISLVLIGFSMFNTRIYRATVYANVIKVTEADFSKYFSVSYF